MNKKQKKRVAVVIVAAGSSSRMGTKARKQYLPLNNGTVLSESVKIFLETLDCAVLSIAIPTDEDARAREALFADKHIAALIENTKLLIVQGGATRQASVKNALEVIAATTSFDGTVFIHDAARPFVTAKIINDVGNASATYGAAVPVIPATDTQKIVDKSGFIKTHLQRNTIASIQTPQAFDFKRILAAHRQAEHDGTTYTDDTEIWDKYDSGVAVVAGDRCNKKITYAEDANEITQQFTEKQRFLLPRIAVGMGYDMHRLIQGRKLLIGGVVLPFDKGEDGHSDGDVLFHAVTDALLGAAALGDIGSFFPDTDAAWKNANSFKLLKLAWEKITALSWQLINLDCVIKLETPKFLPYRERVRTSIATALNTEHERIFVKAKTGEKLGAVGESRAVEAWCTCLLAHRE
ncbi:MAG: 2-C-methyl-D-erythritol 2,4-cyclodiphosphate synthase [Treponema sp.]|nr:2-C-methyl-D-erythritol 2,4-cyclodiphosphate synthase [Treponema sp.]